MEYITREQYERMREYIKNASEDKKYKTYLSYSECNEKCKEYLADDMKMLKKIIDTAVDSMKRYSDKRVKEELKDKAYEVFVNTLGTYNPESGCKFNSFLYGNISRKIYSYGRDSTRNCRCDRKPDIDQETGLQKVDENGELKYIPVFDYSLHSKTHDGIELHEKIESKYSAEPDILKEQEYIGDDIKEFLNGLTKKNRRIAIYIMDGMTQENMESVYSVTKREYNDALKEFMLFKNVSVIKGRINHAKNR